MAYYITHAEGKHFQPMNANFGLLPELPERIKDKKSRYEALANRALTALEAAKETVAVVLSKTFSREGVEKVFWIVLKLGSGYHMINSNNSEGGDDRDWGMGHIASRVSAAVSIAYIQIVGWLIVLFVLIFCRFSAFQFVARPVYVAFQSLDR